MKDVRIRLEGISKSYYAKSAVTQALRKVSLTFRMGEFVAITGESGSGKSTLLNIIGGMDVFDDGEMYVDGQPTFQYDEADWEEHRRSKIGYVFQDYSLIGHYSVLDNMVSGLLVMGKGKEEAKETARHYLNLVGLSEYETHKATELSSGQKQRLSIARALAKETGILVADEPTGNLDSETGEQIIALLKELSKDRLVIMVTHNYEQAAAYVTRKIRIHDGEVVVDVAVDNGADVDTQTAGGNAQTGEAEEPGADSGENAHAAKVLMGEKEPSFFRKQVAQLKTAAFFAGKNAITQVGRATLFTAFLTIIALASFLLIGQLARYEDDIITKGYSDKAFRQQNDTRLVVKKADGSLFTEEDLKLLEKLTHVVTVDSCDYANDINYYIVEDEDFEYQYNRNWWDPNPKVTIRFKSDKKFMRSTDCITEADLAYGRLPEARNEVVLYTEDEKVLNKTRTCYFKAQNIWDSGEYYVADMKVVGILKEETKQVYFSKELCQMLSMDIDSDLYRLVYNYDYKLMDYAQKPEMILVINDALSGNRVRVSKSIDAPVSGEILFRHFTYDGNGEIDKEAYTEVTVDVMNNTTQHTRDFLEVSKEFYDTYYKAENKQASVYITSYAKTDEVLQALKGKGFDAVSTARVGADKYDQQLVTERLTLMAICVGGLMALVLAEVLILRSLMKIRIKDYFVLKFIGMKLPVIRKISLLEIGAYCLVAMGLTIGIMWGLGLAGVPVIVEMMYFYEGKAYLLFVLYNLILMGITVASFNKILKGRLNA